MFKQFATRYGTALEDEMRHTVDSLQDAPDAFKDMMRYPMGWTNADGTPYTQPTGKRIRPLVVLLCAEASGGDWQQALPAASAVEILHNFSLVHDDIQDASDTRHSRETVWRVWGQPMAINIGDAMFALAYHSLERLTTRDLPAATTLAAWRVFNHTILELTRGQYLDMSFETRDAVTADDYLSMIKGKTAALLAACAQIGALVGSGDEQIAREYAAFGLNLGIAFQVRDDILGIWGEPDATGKSAATDIISRKKSLPVLYALERNQALREIYAGPDMTDANVKQAITLLEETGAQDYAQQTEETYYNAALSSLARANPQGPAAEQLQALVSALFGRAF